MELKTYLRAIWTAMPWLILGTLIAVVAAVLVSIYVLEPMYSASATLLVSYGDVARQESGYSATLTSERLAKTYSVLITDEEVMRRAIEKAGVDMEPAVLAMRTRVTVPPGTSVLEVTVEDPDPMQAAKLANAIADAFIEYVAELQSELGVGNSAYETNQLYRTSLERADLAAALDSYVRSYGDLMGVYVALTKEIRSYDEAETVYSPAELDEMGANIRQQMAAALDAISSLEAEITKVKEEHPALGMTRKEWFDELDRLENLILQYRTLHASLLDTEAALKEAQVQQEQRALETLLQQRDLEMQAQAQMLPPPPLPSPTPGPRFLESQLTSVISETVWVKDKLTQAEVDLAAHLETEPVDVVITQRDIDARMDVLRSELRQKQTAYASLLNSYMSYLQFLQSNVQPARPEEDIADFEDRRARIAEEADIVWQQTLELRQRLQELDRKVFTPPGPPLVVTSPAVPSLRPVRPNPILNGLIAGAVTFVLIVLVVLLLEYFRATDELPIGAK